MVGLLGVRTHNDQAELRTMGGGKSLRQWALGLCSYTYVRTYLLPPVGVHTIGWSLRAARDQVHCLPLRLKLPRKKHTCPPNLLLKGQCTYLPGSDPPLKVTLPHHMCLVIAELVLVCLALHLLCSLPGPLTLILRFLL